MECKTALDMAKMNIKVHSFLGTALLFPANLFIPGTHCRELFVINKAKYFVAQSFSGEIYRLMWCFKHTRIIILLPKKSPNSVKLMFFSDQEPPYSMITLHEMAETGKEYILMSGSFQWQFFSDWAIIDWYCGIDLRFLMCVAAIWFCLF